MAKRIGNLSELKKRRDPDEMNGRKGSVTKSGQQARKANKKAQARTKYMK